METKQIQTNVFTDGLNTDLHPLTTPNTVLTDCINGTIITYNGNEYILQNDMGNYQLSKAKLPADYIPIGIKEYGNIVYIVSYNPLDKKCQIGSYPSPQTLFDNTEHESKNAQYQGIAIPQLGKKWQWVDGIKSVTYTDANGVPYTVTDVFFTDLKSKTNIIILFPENGDNKDTFLNPGDKYYIQVDDQSETWKFQRCEYYTLTESKEVIKIKDDLINIKQDTFNGKFYNVRWETPGWIGYKPTLLEPISFDLSLTNLQSPTFVVTNQKDDLPETNLTVSVQGQLIVDANKWEQYYDNLRVYFHYKLEIENDSTKGDNQHQYAELSSVIHCRNKTDILTYNANFSNTNITNPYKITIKATPYIIEDTNGFIYDNLSTTYTIDSDTISKISDISCFDIYKYLVNDEGVTLNFTIESPISKVGDLDCRYRIWAFDDGMQNVHKAIDFTSIDSLNMFGQNILTIDWKGEFQKEEIYLFELAFGNLTNGVFTPIYQNVQVLITSELLNDFYSTTNRFQDLSLSEWTANISKYVKIPDLDNALTETQIQKYDWAVNVNNIDQLFSANFYENATNDLGGAYTASDELVENVINQDRYRIAGYYGMVSAVCGRLKYTMLPPEILDGKGIWTNVKWENVTESDVITYRNGEKFTNHYVSSNNLFDKVAIVDYSANVIHAQYYLYKFMTDRYQGIITKKWYLYNNLLYGLPLFAQSNPKRYWDITEILLNSENKLDYSWTNDDLINLTKNAQCTQMCNYKPYMWKIWQTSVYGKREKGYFKKFWKNQSTEGTDETNETTNEERFFTFEWNNTKDEPNNDVHWPNATKFDKLIMSKESNPWWGIPIWIKTNNFKDDNYKNRKIWHFSDGTDIKHYNGHCNNCAFLAIPCDNETYTSLAVIKFFDNTPQTENFTDPKNAFFGTFVTNDKTWNSSWLVNPNAVGKNAIPHLYLDKNTSQHMSQMIAIFFFALGIHLYGVYKTDNIDEQIVSMEDKNQLVGHNSQEITVNYTRNDILNQVKYKNIDLTNQQNSWIVSNKILETIIGKDYLKKDYTISTAPNNLSSGYIATNNTIKTKKAPYRYTINSELSDIAQESSAFVTALDNKLRDKIKEITESSSLLDNVYVDEKIATFDTLDKIASMLKFKWENNCGKFYYNDLPEATIGIRTDDANGDNFIRSLDWSKIINWDSLYTALVPSSDFQKTELKNKNGNN